MEFGKLLELEHELCTPELRPRLWAEARCSQTAAARLLDKVMQWRQEQASRPDSPYRVVTKKSLACFAREKLKLRCSESTMGKFLRGDGAGTVPWQTHIPTLMRYVLQQDPSVATSDENEIIDRIVGYFFGNTSVYFNPEHCRDGFSKTAQEAYSELRVLERRHLATSHADTWVVRVSGYRRFLKTDDFLAENPSHDERLTTPTVSCLRSGINVAYVFPTADEKVSEAEQSVARIRQHIVAVLGETCDAIHRLHLVAIDPARQEVDQRGRRRFAAEYFNVRWRYVFYRQSSEQGPTYSQLMLCRGSEFPTNAFLTSNQERDDFSHWFDCLVLPALSVERSHHPNEQSAAK